MANQTPNKGLTLPISTERYSVDVFNKNNQIIDAELHNLDEKNTEQDNKLSSMQEDLSGHKNNNNNPHKVTASQIGLGKVENKSSEDIRNELTSDNVTGALGYTPYTPAEIDDKFSANVIPKATDEVDGLLSKEDHSKYDDANAKKHVHDNKFVLDGITADFISSLTKGIPNGIPTLDNNSKIPKEQLPEDIGYTEWVGTKEAYEEQKDSIPDGLIVNIVDDYDPAQGDITIDDHLNKESENPVQNKVIATEIESLKKSVSDGKSLVAGAITNKGVQTATDATFQEMATNVGSIKTTPNLQAKTVTPLISSQLVKADGNYDGLSQVTVNPVPFDTHISYATSAIPTASIRVEVDRIPWARFATLRYYAPDNAGVFLYAGDGTNMRLLDSVTYAMGGYLYTGTRRALYESDTVIQARMDSALLSQGQYHVDIIQTSL